MRAIVVDDEPIMIHSFLRLSAGIPNLNVVSTFSSPYKALAYAEDHALDVAFLDIAMPKMNGVALAAELRQICPDIMIVFVTAFDEYIRDANKMGAQYYIVKPYTREILEHAVQLLHSWRTAKTKKDVFIRTFGCFTVLHRGKPVDLQGKAKEILALVVTSRGREISNEKIYSTIWENRKCDNVSMKVYYNALHRLKLSLEKAGLSRLLISTTRGQLVNTDLFDCDYYAWVEERGDDDAPFEGEFLTEYSWAESILADMLERGA